MLESILAGTIGVIVAGKLISKAPFIGTQQTAPQPSESDPGPSSRQKSETKQARGKTIEYDDKNWYNSTVTAGRKVEPKNAAPKYPRDGSQKVNPNDPVYTLQEKRGSAGPPRPRRKEIWRPREEVVNTAEPWTEWNALTSDPFPGYTAMKSRLTIGSLMNDKDAHGSIFDGRGELDDRVTKYESMKTANVPKHILFDQVRPLFYL